MELIVNALKWETTENVIRGVEKKLLNLQKIDRKSYYYLWILKKVTSIEYKNVNKIIVWMSIIGVFLWWISFSRYSLKLYIQKCNICRAGGVTYTWSYNLKTISSGTDKRNCKKKVELLCLCLQLFHERIFSLCFNEVTYHLCHLCYNVLCNKVP